MCVQPIPALEILIYVYSYMCNHIRALIYVLSNTHIRALIYVLSDTRI